MKPTPYTALSPGFLPSVPGVNSPRILADKEGAQHISKPIGEDIHHPRIWCESHGAPGAFTITMEAFAADILPVGHPSTHRITMRKERGAYRLERKGGDRQRIGRRRIAPPELQIGISLSLL